MLKKIIKLLPILLECSFDICLDLDTYHLKDIVDEMNKVYTLIEQDGKDYIYNGYVIHVSNDEVQFDYSREYKKKRYFEIFDLLYQNKLPMSDSEGRYYVSEFFQEYLKENNIPFIEDRGDVLSPNLFFYKQPYDPIIDFIPMKEDYVKQLQGKKLRS